MLNQYMKGANAALSPHFNSREFDCSCPQCTVSLIDSELIAKLEVVRGTTGPLKTNSGYRCQHKQDELRLAGYETSLGVSQHELGRAADITTPDSRFTGPELEAKAREAGFMAVGVGQYWIHVDLRNDKDRRWVYAR